MANFSNEGNLPLAELMARVRAIKVVRFDQDATWMAKMVDLWKIVLEEIGSERMRGGWITACLEALKAWDPLTPEEEKQLLKEREDAKAAALKAAEEKASAAI